MQGAELFFNHWVNLTEAQKQQSFRQMLRYFVNPLLPISRIHFQKYPFFGQTFITMSVVIGGEKFLFVPGQTDVVLGWEQGASRLATADWFAKSADYHDEEMLGFQSKEDVDDYINQQTSQIRKRLMSPMLLAQKARPVDQRVKGIYHMITGEFKGDEAFFEDNKREIQGILNAGHDPLNPFGAHHLINNLGGSVSVQPYGDDIHFEICEKVPANFGQLNRYVHGLGMTLPSQDTYEYAMSGGLRSLFTWGNSLQVKESQFPDTSRFGFPLKKFRTPYQLTQDREILKSGPPASNQGYLVEKVLPLSPFYQSEVAQTLLPDEEMNPEQYQYRSQIRINLD